MFIFFVICMVGERDWCMKLGGVCSCWYVEEVLLWACENLTMVFLGVEVCLRLLPFQMKMTYNWVR